jgi:hypothetical protein
LRAEEMEISKFAIASGLREAEPFMLLASTRGQKLERQLQKFSSAPPITHGFR